MSENKQSKILKQSGQLLSIIALEGLAAALWLLLIPKEPGNAVFLGYSLRRLAVLVVILLLPLLALMLKYALKHGQGWLAGLLKEDKLPRTSHWIIYASTLACVLVWMIFLLIPQPFMDYPFDEGVFVRLLPLLFYVLAIGLEALMFVPFILYPESKTDKKVRRAFPIKPLALSFALLLAVWAIIELTGMGKNPEKVSINSLGVPLLEGQIWFIAGLIVIAFCAKIGLSRLPQEKDKKQTKINPDLLIGLLLWALAVVLWLGLPLPRHNYFAPQTLPPNYKIYPFSDAEQYDMNALWVWKGSIKDTVVSKPLYVIFLSILHALVGFDYSKVIFLQTLVLAILPVVLYLIGKELRSRFGGIIFALFAIFREVNAIQATDISNVSNSKLYLSDLPATLLLALLILVIIRWFNQKDRSATLRPFIIGGILAGLNLMRIQTLVLEPFVVLLAIIRDWKNPKKILTSVLLIIAALSLVLAPVLVRNHAITGVYWIDNPTNSSALYTFFTRSGDFDVEVSAAETEEEMLNRNFDVILQIITTDFLKVLDFVVDNFFRNIISTILVLPVRLGNSIGFFDYLHISEPFWGEVYSTPNLLNLLVILLNLFIISVGAVSVFSKNKKGLWVVLSFYLVYNLSSALVRLSGWRFILPVDWIAYALFAFGLIEIIQFVFNNFFAVSVFDEDLGIENEKMPAGLTEKPAKPIFAYALGFLLLGTFISIRASILPVGYPEAGKGEVCTIVQEALGESEWAAESADFYQFCMQDDTLAYTGIGFYPRYFKEDSGFYERSYDPYFGEQEYARLVFRTIGEPNSKVYIKTDDTDIRFKDGSAVYVIGKDEDKFEASVVLIIGKKPYLIMSTEGIPQ